MNAVVRHALVFAVLLLVPLCALADDVPTIDLQSGTDYAVFRKLGLKLLEGEMISEGVRGNDFIQERTLRVVVSPGKSFTLDNPKNTGAVSASADGSAVLAYFFFGSYATPEETKKKMREIGDALGFDADKADAVFEGKRPLWTAVGDAAAPFWAVEVASPFQAGLPYEIRVVFAWDLDQLKKAAGKAYFIHEAKKKMPPGM